MDRINRLIAKAKKLGFSDGDVFLISGESGIWKVRDREFPDFEAAEKYVDMLIKGTEEESVVIINDLTPDYLKDLEKQIKKSDKKRNKDELRRKKKEEQKRQQREAEHRIKEKEREEKELREPTPLEEAQPMEADKDKQLI